MSPKIGKKKKCEIAKNAKLRKKKKPKKNLLEICCSFYTCERDYTFNFSVTIYTTFDGKFTNNMTLKIISNLYFMFILINDEHFSKIA